MLDNVAGQYAGKIRFFKVNVDESPELAQRFQIHGLPTVLVFKKGEVTTSVLGYADEQALKTKLQGLL